MTAEAEARETHVVPADDVILRAEGITKVFEGTVALKEVDFDVYRGKVNVLIGGNGAGKSTLMKILAGVEQPTQGRLLLDGKEIALRSPRDAQQLGIGIIYQELNLAPNLNVAENIFLARELTAYGVTVNKKAQEHRARQLMKRLEHPIDPRTPVGDLRLGEQQIVEIAKALAQNVRILIMDEPTSALTAAEVAVLFRIIRELKSAGVSIIYISHKLEELLQIGDYVTVLRDGRLVVAAPAHTIDVPWIVGHIVGRTLNAFFKQEEHEAQQRELLRVENLTLPRPEGGYLVDHVSFTLRQGEILGIYGFLGAGRTELLESLSGYQTQAEGTILLDGKAIKAARLDQRIKAGVVLVPEDRQSMGLVPPLSVIKNMTLANLRSFTKGFYLSAHAEESAASRLIRELSIKVSDPHRPITTLSGGNQQKVIVSKALLTDPKVLLLDEPTRGIDIGAKADMFQIMTKLAAQGLGIIFASSELMEVLAMADRILVMSQGKITGEFTRGSATEEALVAAASVGHTLPEGSSAHETD